MPSEFQKILMSMQSDLNALTLSSVAANQALYKMLSLYGDEEYSVDKNRQCTKNWSIALDTLANALDAFMKDACKLEEYINGQR